MAPRCKRIPAQSPYFLDAHLLCQGIARQARSFCWSKECFIQEGFVLYIQVLHHPLQIVALSPRRLKADSEPWHDVESCPVQVSTSSWCGREGSPTRNHNQTCLIQRARDLSSRHASTWMRGVKSTTLTSMPPVPMFDGYSTQCLRKRLRKVCRPKTQ